MASGCFRALAGVVCLRSAILRKGAARVYDGSRGLRGRSQLLSAECGMGVHGRRSIPYSLNFPVAGTRVWSNCLGTVGPHSQGEQV